MIFLALTLIFQCDFFPEHHRNWHGSWCTHLCAYWASFSRSVSCSEHTRTTTVVWNHPCTPAIFCYWGYSIGLTSSGPTRWDRSCSWYFASLWLWCWSISSWLFWWRFMLRYVPSFPLILLRYCGDKPLSNGFVRLFVSQSHFFPRWLSPHLACDRK